MLVTYLLALLAALAVCGTLFICLFPILSQRSFSFTDFIIETVARTGYDKSAELTLFWALLAIGVLLLALVILISKMWVKKKAGKASDIQTAPTRLHSKQIFSSLPVYSFVALFPFLTILVLYGTCNLILALGIAYTLGIAIFSKKTNAGIGQQLLLPVFIYYCILALLTALFYFTDRLHVTTTKLYLTTFILTACFLFVKRELTQKAMLVMQCCIPLLSVVYFVDTYLYQGNKIHVRYALFYYVFFAFLLIALMALAIRHAIKSWSDITEKVELSCAKLVCISTPIIVFIYNSFSAAPLYAQPDQHHHGEQMIPWQQIMTLGQSAYEEYTPVSGLFPMVNGFIQNVLMRATVSDYSPAISVTMVLFCILTMTLIYLHVDGAYALLFAVFFALPSYNRQYMVLPVLLLLFLPKLLEKPIPWLLTWIYTCFLAGLYYPLYGAAVLIGTLPIGFSVLNKLRKQMDWSKEHKKTLPVTRCMICFIPILLSIPLLFKILNHTLTYSSQTQMADGITLFGQTPPDYFMPYLTASHAGIRQWLYLSYRFLLPMFAVWLIAALLFLLLKKNKHLSYFMLAGIITLCISYTYTLVRADVNVILSRTAPILLAVCGMFFPIMLLSYRKRNKLTMDSRVLLIVLGICFSLPSMVYLKVSHMKFPDMWIYPNGEATLIMDDTDKLYSYYEVPELLVKMDSIDIHDKSMLGNGFMVSDQISYLQQYESVMEKCETAIREHAVSDFTPDISYMGFDGQGFYYYLNAKACATGFIQAGKGYEAQQAILKQVKEKQPVIFLIEPQCNYYVYVWMMQNNYVYSEQDHAFYPHKLYCLVYDEPLSKAGITTETDTSVPLGNPSLYANGMLYGDDYRQTCQSTDFGLVCSSFGASFDTLRPLLISEDPLTSFDDEEGIDGLTNDILYMQWASDGIRTLYQDCIPDEHNNGATLTMSLSFLCDGKQYDGASVSCQLTENNLLIPMGMNADWLLSTNSELTVSILDAKGTVLLSMPMNEFAKKYLSRASFYQLSRER